MKINQIYIYPIKSLRGISLSSAEATRTGFRYDRRFMLLKVIRDTEMKTHADTNTDDKDGTRPTLKNMHVVGFPEMGLFRTEFGSKDRSDEEMEREGEERVIRVRYRDPATETSLESQVGDEGEGGGGGEKTLDIPLEPDTTGLEEIPVTMHGSPTTGYNMGREYNEWFSGCFGYEVVLVYLGGAEGDWRRVLGSFEPARHKGHKGLQRSVLADRWWWWWVGVVGFVSTLALTMHVWIGMTVAMGGAGSAWYCLSSDRERRRRQEERITFADCSPYLVISATSVADVSGRLQGAEMDQTKFRANIVVEGAATAFEEDFWAELAVGDGARLLLTANCIRCRSLDIDYATGKMGTGKTGKVFGKLAADRRVDHGAKYSPVFGRYAFLGGEQARTIRVGDEVVVARWMQERSVHDWPGLA